MGRYSMATIGYARVSSSGQSLEVQLSKLAHCDKIFEEKRSGSNMKREALARCMEYVREGDTLVITRLDRLARSINDLCHLAAELDRKKVALHIIDQQIDTSTASGRLMFNMLGVIAQFENELRAERQADGIKKAKEKGIKFGRHESLTQEQVLDMIRGRSEGNSIKHLMNRFGVGRSTIYRYLGQQK